MSTATLDPISTDLSAAQTPPSPADLLRVGRERGQQAGVIYAGGVYPQEAWALFSAGAAQLVDVRSAGEFAAANAPGTVNIPLGDLGNRLSDIPKTAPVVVGCASAWLVARGAPRIWPGHAQGGAHGDRAAAAPRLHA